MGGTVETREKVAKRYPPPDEKPVIMSPPLLVNPDKSKRGVPIAGSFAFGGFNQESKAIPLLAAAENPNAILRHQLGTGFTEWNIPGKVLRKPVMVYMVNKAEYYHSDVFYIRFDFPPPVPTDDGDFVEPGTAQYEGTPGHNRPRYDQWYPPTHDMITANLMVRLREVCAEYNADFMANFASDILPNGRFLQGVFQDDAYGNSKYMSKPDDFVGAHLVCILRVDMGYNEIEETIVEDVAGGQYGIRTATGTMNADFAPELANFNRHPPKFDSFQGILVRYPTAGYAQSDGSVFEELVPTWDGAGLGAWNASQSVLSATGASVVSQLSGQWQYVDYGTGPFVGFSGDQNSVWSSYFAGISATPILNAVRTALERIVD